MEDYRLAQPHFDDERTLISARPVVPLEKIQAKVKHRRLWLLGGAFAIAMMLGAGSALLASYLRLKSAPEPATQISQEITPAPQAVAESVPSDSPPSESQIVENVEEPSITPVETTKESPIKHKALARRAPDIDLPRDEPKVNEQDDLHRISDAVLYEQWQERRARRVARRERRKADRYNHRDLSNLDEIFEGRRKP